MAITCPPGTFSIQTLLLYFRHSHSLLFVLLFIILSLTWRILISGGRSARGKIMCFSFGQIFCILWPHSSNLFYQFRPSFCVLFVLWLYTHKETTQHGNSIYDRRTGRFSTRRWGSTSRPWPLHVQGHGLWAAVFDSTRIVPNGAAALRAFAHQMTHHGFSLHSILSFLILRFFPL